MLGWLAGAALASPLAFQAGEPSERELVVGQRYQNLTFQGAPWQPGRAWIEGSGKGNALYSDLALGPATSR